MDSVHCIVSFEFFTLQQVLSRNSKSAEASIEHSFNTYGKRYRHVYGFSISYFQILPTKNIFIYFSFYCNLMMLVLFFHGMFLFLIFCLLLLYYFAHSISRISPYFPQFTFACKLFYITLHANCISCSSTAFFSTAIMLAGFLSALVRKYFQHRCMGVLNDSTR